MWHFSDVGIQLSHHLGSFSTCDEDRPVKVKRLFLTAKLVRTHSVCLYGLVILCLTGGTPTAYAKSSHPGNDVPDTDFRVERRPQLGPAQDAGEYYRVPGRRIRLLRSLKKVAVHYVPEPGLSFGKTLNAGQEKRRLFALEQEPVKGCAVVLRSTDTSSLAELDAQMDRLQQASDVDQVTPVYISEETGLEMILTGEFIVKLASNATLAQLRAFNRSMGVSLVRRLRGTTDQFVLSMDGWMDGHPKRS